MTRPRTTPCSACGTHVCNYGDPDPNTDEPCYGEIRSIDFDEAAVGDVDELVFDHACEGHRRFGKYTPEGA